MKTAASLLALSIAFALPAGAQDSGQRPPSAAEATKGDRVTRSSGIEQERESARLDLMFGRLAKAPTERQADRIARNIMARLTRSGSSTADFLMNRAAKAIKDEELGLALDFLNGIIRDEPDFAEAWNRRATVYFMKGDYGRSLADIEQVLRIEPRHWGALSGLAIILSSLERNREALTVMDKVLSIHPYLDEIEKRRDKLRAQVDGSDI